MEREQISMILIFASIICLGVSNILLGLAMLGV